jgi:Fe-S-cluster containining protein
LRQGSGGVIELTVQDQRIELVGYDGEDTLADLVVEVERFRLVTELKTRYCYGCGQCCHDPIPVLGGDLAELRRQSAERGVDLSRYVSFPDPPDLEERREGIADMIRQHDLTPLQATLLYEHNCAEPLTLARSETGACRFLESNLCTIYPHRPFACRLYVCNMADRLEGLYETIVRQGVWHSYHELGWVPAEEISHNPFLGAEGYDRIRLQQFDFDLEGALQSLFFYF